MNLTLGPDEQQVADSAARFLAEMLPVARHHSGAAAIPAETYKKIADLGWFAIALPERLGGLGMTPVEEALVFREIGRGLGPTMILTGALAANVAAAAGRNAITADLLAGEAFAALAVPMPSLTAPQRPFQLYDCKGGRYAVTVERTGAALFDLSAISVEELPCLDKSVSLGQADFAGVTPLARVAGPEIYRRAALAVAAMQSGIAEAALAMIVAYAKIRVTFGRPIGAYQAVRHPCADMAVRCEAARAQLFYAAVALRDGIADCDLMLEAASVLAHDAAISNVDANIQLHGGIGITDEHDAHLYLKRAQVVARWLGFERLALDRIAAESIRSAA